LKRQAVRSKLKESFQGSDRKETGRFRPNFFREEMKGPTERWTVTIDVRGLLKRGEMLLGGPIQSVDKENVSWGYKESRFPTRFKKKKKQGSEVLKKNESSASC